jgi:uncharacterized membrane protein YqhA
VIQEPGSQGGQRTQRPPGPEAPASAEGDSQARRLQRGFERMLTLSRLLVLIPVIFLLLDAAGSFVYGSDILVRSATGLIGEPAKIGGRLGLFLIVMDTFLVGATLMIAAFGFYELFIIKGEREGRRYWLPGWLQMHDLEDLKARVVSMLILVAAITFVDRTVEAHDEQEVLFLGIGISIIIAALTGFLWFGKRRPSADPRAASAPMTTGQNLPPAGSPAPVADPALAPADSPPRPRGARRASGPTSGHAADRAGKRPARVIALLGSSRRDGGWNAAPRTDVIAFAGRARIDITNADVRGERLKIRVISVFGLVSIAVPPEMAVADSGLALLGSRSVRGGTSAPGTAGTPGAPELVLSGACILGAVRVRRKPQTDPSGDFS